MTACRLTSLTSTLRKFIDYLASGVVLATTVVIGCTLMAGVISRYVFSNSLSWSAELPLILFPWLVLAGIVMAAVRQEHLGVDYVVRKFSPGLQKLVAIVMEFLIAATMGMLAFQSQFILQFLQYQTTPVLGWSAAWAFYSLPAGAICLLLLSLIRVADLCFAHGGAKKQQPDHGDSEHSGETMQ